MSEQYQHDCSKCGQSVNGDTQALVSHMLRCTGDKGAARDMDASATDTSSPTQQGSRWQLFGGSAVARRNYIEEELPLLQVSFDTLEVMYADHADRLPCVYVDLSAMPVDGQEVRIGISAEYVPGYPHVPPNLDLVEARKGMLRRSASDFLKHEIESFVNNATSGQEPYLMQLFSEMQELLKRLTLANQEALEAEDDQFPEFEFPAPQTPVHADANTHTMPPASPEHRATRSPSIIAKDRVPQIGSAGGSGINSALTTPLHTAAAAPTVTFAPIGPAADSSRETAELQKRSRSLELFAMHMLRRLCDGSPQLPASAYDTFRVYLQDVGIVYDAKVDASYRLLRRSFKSVIDQSTHDRTLSWLWAPSIGDGDAGGDRDGATGSSFASEVSQPLRFEREFVKVVKLGVGGFGAVYQCIRNVDHRKYAVKMVGMHVSRQVLVLREVRTLASLAHPNIVHYYDCWAEAGKRTDLVEEESDDDVDEDWYSTDDEAETQRVEGVFGASSSSSTDESVADREDTRSPRRTPNTAPPVPAHSVEKCTVRTTVQSAASAWAADFSDDDEYSDEDDEDGEDAAAADGGSDDVADDDMDVAAMESPSPTTETYMSAGGMTTARTTSSTPTTKTNGNEPDLAGSAAEHCTLYLQMELCQADNLQDHIDNGTLQGREDVIHHILRQLLNVLDFVHKRNAIHRDLKPANVLFDGTADNLLCDIKVADFGLARKFGTSEEPESTAPTAAKRSKRQRVAAEDATDSKLTTGCGTLLYAAPEQVAGEMDDGSPYGPKVDEYSVGIIWFEMWASSLTTLDYRERREAIGELRRTAKVPEWLRKAKPIAADVIERLVTHDPRERASAEEILAMPKLPGDPPEIMAALDTISDHRDRIAPRVIQRLLATAHGISREVTSSASVPELSVQHIMKLYERAAGLANAAVIDAHLEVIPSGQIRAGVVDARNHERLLDRRGDSVMLLRDPALCVGSWFSRRSRSLHELGSGGVFRSVCIHTPDADRAYGTYAAYASTLSVGLRVAEVLGFASTFFRMVPPPRGGYVTRLYHPCIADEARAMGLDASLMPNLCHTPAGDAPTLDWLAAPVRIRTVEDWRVVHTAATRALQGRSAAARAALDELDNVVETLCGVAQPSDLPLEVFLFGQPPNGNASASGGPSASGSPRGPRGLGSSQSLENLPDMAADGSAPGRGQHHFPPSSGVVGYVLRLHDDGLATGTTRRPGSRGKAADAAAGMRLFDVVARVQTDPFASASVTGNTSSSRLVVLTTSLTPLAKFVKEVPVEVGCVAAACRPTGGSAGGPHFQTGFDADVQRVLAAAKACWAGGNKAEPVYRVERNEVHAATAARTRHGMSHFLALYKPDAASPVLSRFKFIRHGMSSRDISQLEFLTTPIADAAREVLLSALSAGGGGAAGAIAGADVPSHAAAQALIRTHEDAAAYAKVEFLESTTAHQRQELQRKAFTAYAHYAKFLVPRRILVLEDGDSRRIRHTIAEFTSYRAGESAMSPSSLHKGLFDWLRHNNANLYSVAVYVAKDDTVDLVVNHKQACPTGGWVSGRGAKKSDKGKSRR